MLTDSEIQCLKSQSPITGKRRCRGVRTAAGHCLEGLSQNQANVSPPSLGHSASSSPPERDVNDDRRETAIRESTRPVVHECFSLGANGVPKGAPCNARAMNFCRVGGGRAAGAGPCRLGFMISFHHYAASITTHPHDWLDGGGAHRPLQSDCRAGDSTGLDRKPARYLNWACRSRARNSPSRFSNSVATVSRNARTDSPAAGKSNGFGRMIGMATTGLLGSLLTIIAFTISANLTIAQIARFSN